MDLKHGMKMMRMDDDQGEKEGQGEEEDESRGGLQSVSPTQLTWNVEFELNNEIENLLINEQSYQSASAFGTLDQFRLRWDQDAGKKS